MEAIGFDFDGTLVRAFTAEPLPGVQERIAALPATARLFVATNQGGPVWRAVTCQTRYPTARGVVENLLGGLAACGLPWEILLIATDPGGHLRPDPDLLVDVADMADRAAALMVAALTMLHADPPGRRTIWDASGRPSWRKPEPQMLISATSALGVQRRASVYIGDMDTDREAAELAGMQFLSAEDWLAGRAPWEQA